MKRALGLLIATLALVTPSIGSPMTSPNETWPPREGGLLPSNILYVEIPEGLSAGSEEMRELARKAIAARVPAIPRRSPTTGERLETKPDWIVIFTDHGKPVLPDLERTGSNFGASTNTLTFTFNSPSRPWTPDEMVSMEAYIADFYPVIVSIYGPPGFNNVVNIRKDAVDGGYYFPSINEIVVEGTTSSLCHEIIHAFHDEAIMMSVFEEGMTRAAQIEAYNQLGAWEYTGEHHSDDMFDVYYDLLNQPEASTRYGFGDRGMFFYQIGGYAWAKPYLEDATFFGRFHQAYYSAVATDPATRWDASKILFIAGSVRPEVEGESFATWCQKQYVLRTDAPAGYCLSVYSVDEGGGRFFYFRRTEGGGEEPMPGVPIDWKVFDHSDRLMASGTVPTDEYGHMWLSLTQSEVPWDYTGRMKLVVSVTAPDGRVLRNVSERPRSATGVNSWVTNGIFGVVRDALQGEVTAVHVESGARETASLSNGFFQLPAVSPLAGAFRVSFRYPDGRSQERMVTKDASDYYLLLGAETPPIAENLAPNPSFEDDNLTGWDPYHGSSLIRAENGEGGSVGSWSGDYSLHVRGPSGTEQFGVNDHPNFVRSASQSGAVYRFTAYVYVRSVPEPPYYRGECLGTCRIRVREYENEVRIGGSNYSNSSRHIQGWQQLTLDYRSKVSGSSLDFQVVFDPDPGFDPALGRAGFWLDDVAVRKLESWEVLTAAEPNADAAPLEVSGAPRFSASVSPNPVRSSGELRYTTTRDGAVRLRLFDVRGRLVSTPVERSSAAAGTYHVPLLDRTGTNIALGMGVYWYRLESTEGTVTGRLVVLK